MVVRLDFWVFFVVFFDFLIFCWLFFIFCRFCFCVCLILVSLSFFCWFLILLVIFVSLILNVCGDIRLVDNSVEVLVSIICCVSLIFLFIVCIRLVIFVWLVIFRCCWLVVDGGVSVIFVLFVEVVVGVVRCFICRFLIFFVIGLLSVGIFLVLVIL